MTKEEIIESLNLELHPTEGGYFRRTYESSLNIESGEAGRKLLTSIYYLLTSDSPIGYLHRNKSDILHFYHLGASIRYLIISPNGEIKEKVLGPNIQDGEVPQLLVKGGEWKATELSSGPYGLLSEAVSPGFEYSDNEIAKAEVIDQLFPGLACRFEKFIKK